MPQVKQHKILLDESEMPTRWYNILHDLPDAAAAAAASRHRSAGRPGRPRSAVPDGPDHAGGDGRAVRRHPRGGARRLPAVAAVARCSAPTGSRRRWAPRPGSTTSTRASRRPGSHKPNTAVPQAYYNAKAGIRKLTTETGAGQWGTALAFACAQFDIECEVWQVRASYDQKPYRRMHDRDIRRHRAPEPVRADRRPAGPSWPSIRTPRARSASRSARPSRSPRRTRPSTTRSAAC